MSAEDEGNENLDISGDYDFLDKFVDDCGGEFSYPHIFTNTCEKAVKTALVLFIDIDFLLVVVNEENGVVIRDFIPAVLDEYRKLIVIDVKERYTY